MSGNNHLQISEPCTQNWDQMDIADHGKFCKHCSKTVIDFTGFTDEQILAKLQEQKGGLCARLNPEQLNRPIVNAKNRVERNKLREVFAALVLLLTVREVSADTAPKAPVTYTKTDAKTLKTVPDNTDTTTVTSFSGRVINSKTHAPVADALIENETKRFSNSAGKAGRFQIAASIGDTINISYPGYEAIEFVITDLKFENHALVQNAVEPSLPIMGAVRYDPKPTPVDSVKQFFGLK